MNDQEYREILPFAYVAAAIERGGAPDFFSVGMHARAIFDAAYEKNPARRVALAVPIPAEIIDVKRSTTSFGADFFDVTYRELATKEHEINQIKTPLLNDRFFGPATAAIWDREQPDGRNYWAGKKMLLYKHNDPPREGDRCAAGYRRVVYAKPL